MSDHELCVAPNGKRICCHCGVAEGLWALTGPCVGSGPKADFIEFKTPADARKARELFQEMSNKITELEKRIEHIEGHLVL